MTFQTIQARHNAKHLTKISNLRCFSLENNFSGVLADDQVRVLDFALNRLVCRMQISKDEGKGRIRAHGNLWYEFDYEA